MAEQAPHIGQSRRQVFLLDDRPDLVAHSITPETMVSAVDRVGDHQDADGLFWPVGGRALARIKNQSVDYGGGSAITCDAMLAEYDPATGEVHLLERLGQRNPRTDPWVVGQNISLLADPNVPSEGVVIRGSQVGAAGMSAHVYIQAPPRKGRAGTPIILHHRTPNPPQNSTLAYDPDAPQNSAPLSDALRIVGGIDNVCKPRTLSKPDDPIDWVVLNGMQSGGRFSGFLATAYPDSVAFHSHLMKGPLRPSTKVHDLGAAHDKFPVRQGALDADALITRGNPDFDCPAWVEDEDEPIVTEPQGHPVRVHFQADPRDRHIGICGLKPKVRKWHVRQPIVETPPCKGADKTAPGAAILPSAYFAGSMLTNGYRFVSHPDA